MNNQSPLDANPIAYLTNEDLHSFGFSRLSELLSVIPIRHLITVRRWEKFLQSGSPLQVYGKKAEGVFEGTVDHNIQGIKNSVPALASLTRSELVLRPVMCLDQIFSYQSQSVFPDLTCLLIGSRTEYEVLSALSYGIQPANLKAIDLISYSPWITPGDMHELPYPDNSFDMIILGWVLGYSNTPKKVAAEIIRVARPGAVVSIGNDCYTMEHIKASQFGDVDVPQTIPALLNCFGSSVDKVYFSHEPNYHRKDIPGFIGHIITTFDIKK